MSVVEKALWYIETRFADGIALDDVAASCAVSRFHLARAFEAATGVPVMRYVRGRRLSEAARRLAGGAPSILAVAIDAGYGSHEAFSRAFRGQFGITPEQVRERRCLETLSLVEPMSLNSQPSVDLPDPRFVDGSALLIAGLGERYTCESARGIPNLWSRFNAHLGHMPGQTGEAAYGICVNSDESGNFDYVAGVEVRDFDDLPPEFKRLRVPAQRYAVFEHRRNVAEIRHSFAAIWNTWLPGSSLRAVDAPVLERYGADFDPESGDGGLEIWVPVADAEGA